MASGDDIVLDRLGMLGDALVELDDEVGGFETRSGRLMASRSGELRLSSVMLALLLPRVGAAGRQARTASLPRPRRLSIVVVIPATAVAGLTPCGRRSHRATGAATVRVRAVPHKGHDLLVDAPARLSSLASRATAWPRSE